MKRQRSPAGKLVKPMPVTVVPADTSPDYMIIYTGIKSFFRPLAKVTIDMVLHFKTLPSPCLEVIGYHQELKLESRLYLVFNDLKLKLNKNEMAAKRAKLIVDAEEQGKVIHEKAIDEAILYSQISHYVLAHLTCTTVITPEFDGRDDNNNENIAGQQQNERDEDGVGGNSFKLGYVGLPTDVPMNRLEGDFDPPLSNDVEWGLSSTTNTLCEVPVSTKSTKGGKPQANATRVMEYKCAELEVEEIDIERPVDR